MRAELRLACCLSLLLALSAGAVRADAPKAPGLRAALLTMRDRDQAARQALSTAPTPENIARVRAVDSRHTARLKRIIGRWGWPGRTLVGEDGASAVWLLVQHADRDRPFQKACLQKMEAAVARGEASPADLAYLADRLAIAEGGKQIYGTQFTMKPGPAGMEAVPDPIADEARLDERRRKVGLGPFAEYAAQLKAMAARMPAPAR